VTHMYKPMEQHDVMVVQGGALDEAEL
jgi:hypothetical protein